MTRQGRADPDLLARPQAAVPGEARLRLAVLFGSAFDGLPGADLVTAGLRDLGRGVVSESSLLVSIGAPRLRALGLAVPRVEENPEHRLYLWLRERDPDAAHGRYNALVRRLVSFERALACVAS